MKFKSFLITPFLLGTLPAANAIPFSDIVVKTDLGEKYIVKKSAVYITNTFDDKDFISLWGNQMKVNRKTLKYVSMDNAYGTLGYCEVFNDFKKLNKAYTKIKNKYQEEYNKTLEGNKI